jgi:hypothetical protein
VQGGDGSELLRGDERARRAQQHGAGTHADAFRSGGHGGREHGRGGRADAGRQMVLGVPDAAVAEAVEVDGEGDGIVHRLGAGAAVGHQGEVKDGQGHPAWFGHERSPW